MAKELHTSMSAKKRAKIITLWSKGVKYLDMSAKLASSTLSSRQIYEVGVIYTGAHEKLTSSYQGGV